MIGTSDRAIGKQPANYPVGVVASGFTLIEVMVVLVIVGVLVGMATLSFGRLDPDSPGAVAQRLQAWLDEARTRALVENRNLWVTEREGRVELLPLPVTDEKEAQAIGEAFEAPAGLRLVWPEESDNAPAGLVVTREGRWLDSDWRLELAPREVASDRPVLQLGANAHGEVEVQNVPD
ncbi:MAG: prepilin-type N-terminal cleavage/methylation domain-containing protein [Halothiobacillaceae bacterium]